MRLVLTIEGCGIVLVEHRTSVRLAIGGERVGIVRRVQASTQQDFLHRLLELCIAIRVEERVDTRVGVTEHDGHEQDIRMWGFFGSEV